MQTVYSQKRSEWSVRFRGKIILVPVCIGTVLCFLPGFAQPLSLEQQPLRLVEGTSAPCPSPGQFSPVRPASDEGPTKVGIGLYLIDITTLDDVQQFFTADLYLVLQWKDPRLADPRRGKGYASCSLPLDRVWNPIVQFDKVRSLQKHYQDVTVIDAEGTVTFAQRFYLDISASLDLRDFPLDGHVLAVDIFPVLSSTEEITFEVMESLTGREDKLSISGWKVSSPKAHVTVKYATRRQINLSHFHFLLEAQRETGFYI